MRSKLAPFIILLCSFSLGTIGKAVAQNSINIQSPQQPQQIFQQDNPNDGSELFTDRATGSSLINLLNRLQQVNGRSPSDFAEEQTESFDNAVDAFRQQQQQKIGEPEATPETPDSTEQ